MSQGTVESGLLEVFAAVLGHPVQIDATRAHEAGWDSLKHMLIVFAVEEKFGVQLTEEEMGSVASFADFAELLERRHAS
ncbi:MAG: hypothetical protein JWM95_3150 [Gemmatimonadetes bacterium]|nr:hypothetical protein [Gemmatimonadota bacterium]